MGPTIGRSIGQGFRAANASWAGMAVFGASWLLVGLVAFVGVAVTNPPREVFEEREAATPEAILPDVTAPELSAPETAPQPAPSEPPAPEAPAPEAAAPPETAGTDLFEQMERAPEAAPAEPDAAAPTVAPAPDLEDLAAADDARRDRLFNEWFGRAWPVLLVCALLILGAGVWLNGGQIGYLVQRVSTGQAKVTDLWRTGAKAFGALLGAWMLSILGAGALLLLFSSFGFLFQALPAAMPDWLVAALAILLLVGRALKWTDRSGISWRPSR